MPSWMKFALRGDTYARALQNAAGRSGARIAPQVLNNISAQPHATLLPRTGPGGASTLAEHARTSTAPSFTPQEHAMNQRMQQMMAPVPHATVENGGYANAEIAPHTFNRQLNAYRQNFVQPGANAGIEAAFGPAALHGEPTAPGTAVQRFRPPTPVERTPTPLPTPTPTGPAPNRQFGRAKFTVEAQPNTTVGKRKIAFAFPRATGAAIPLVIGGGMLLNKPGIKSNIHNLLENKGTTQEQDQNNVMPEQALQQADTIHQTLLAHGLDPATMRIGIDAPPGSGKTTLARALAQRTGMKHYGLDWEPGNAWKSTIGRGRNVEKMPHAPRAGEILEHYLLNRTHDPEVFDAQVHLKRDPAVIRQQLQQRGNAAYIGDMMDLDKSLGVADLGFDTLGGESIDLGNGTFMKLRPREGWGNALDEQLQAKGIDPTGLSRHSKLLSLHSGKRQEGAGWSPYVKNPFSGAETLALGASIPLGVMAARRLMRRVPRIH